MLQTLKVSDFALMDKLELSFRPGFTVLTGETGAGKSILIDAISYVMGTKFNREFIRSGKTSTKVEAVFTCPHEVKAILEREGIPSEERLTLTRENTEAGKSSSWINGKTVLVALLKEISPYLLDIHGQHNNQNLLNPEHHLLYLDEYGDILNSKEFKTYESAYGELKAKERRLSVLTRNNEREKVMDFLTFQIQEIKKQNLSPGEEEELQQKEKMLSHAQRIGDALKAAQEALSEDQMAQLDHSIKALRSVEDVFQGAGETASVIEEAYFNLEEARRDLTSRADEIYYDPNELDEINGRLYTYDHLKKKYGRTTEEVLRELDRMEEELYELTHAEELIQSLKKEIARIKGDVLEKGGRLSLLRREAAASLSNKINSELKFVGLGKADFMPVVMEDQGLTENGTDDVHFMISTNTGEPRKPLEKIVSGGELSRIMLALKSAFIDREGTPTVIFDEIDTGISGSIAQAVGQKMDQIAHNTQVLCVTHLPQIAAWSDHHFIARKEVKKGRTFSEVIYADEEAKTLEIAKMLAGSKITDAILANARELIQTTAEVK